MKKGQSALILIFLSMLLSAAPSADDGMAKRMEEINRTITENVDRIISQIPDLNEQQRRELIEIQARKEVLLIKMNMEMSRMRAAGKTGEEILNYRKDQMKLFRDKSMIRKILSKEQVQAYIEAEQKRTF